MGALVSTKQSKASSTTFGGGGGSRGHRHHQPEEVYSKLHDKEHVKPILTEHLTLLKANAEAEGTIVTQKERLAVIRDATQDAFMEESEEVRAHVHAQLAAQREEPVVDPINNEMV